MQPLLPQNDDSEARNQEIEKQRQDYEWSYYPNLNGTPMIKDLPDREQPFDKHEWIRDAVSIILRIFGNQSLEDFLAGSSYAKFILYGITTLIYRFINNLTNDRFLLWLLKRLKPLLQSLYLRREVSSQKTTTINPEKNSQTYQTPNANIAETGFKPYQDLFQII